MDRAEAIKLAMQHVVDSKFAIDGSNKEYILAHDKYNEMVTKQPKSGRYSGNDLENLRIHAISAYENLLDAMRIHRDNLAHLSVLKGKG